MLIYIKGTLKKPRKRQKLQSLVYLQ